MDEIKQKVLNAIDGSIQFMTDYCETTLFDSPVTWTEANSGDDPDE